MKQVIIKQSKHFKYGDGNLIYIGPIDVPPGTSLTAHKFDIKLEGLTTLDSFFITVRPTMELAMHGIGILSYNLEGDKLMVIVNNSNDTSYYKDSFPLFIITIHDRTAIKIVKAKKKEGK